MEITHITQLSPVRKFSSVSFVQVFSLFVLDLSYGTGLPKYTL
jgi:hypothetical protein